MSRYSHMNVPEDWGSYYRRCEHCGERYHLSEGGPDCNCYEREELIKSLHVDGARVIASARKYHYCDCCDRTISRGDSYLRGFNFNIESGKPETVIVCEECARKAGQGWRWK